MRVLDTETCQFVEADPEEPGFGTEAYAILSHTWDHKGEQTYEQLKKIQRRYISPSQTPQVQSHVPEREASSSPNQDRDEPSPMPHGSQLPTDSAPPTAHPPTVPGQLTQSEVEALRAFIAAYGLTIPPPGPAPPSKSIWDDPELSPKIREACRVAREHGYRYIWIDSCCIDKSSSSELSEAINSMYKWYSLADVCYAYLANVPPGEDHRAGGSAFRESRWFGRGWTLQELIAPLCVEFLSQDWARIGSKHTLVRLVESVTKIDERALLHLQPLEEFSVAQRLSWAAARETTRVEDQAYSLLGLFDINMPTLYGEGGRAFQRLQEQIMQRIPDQSLFAWENIFLTPRPNLDDAETSISLQCQAVPYTDNRQNLFAISPSHFRDGNSISCTLRIHRDAVHFPTSNPPEIEYTSTPYGIRTQLQMIPLTQDLLRRAVPHCDNIELELDSQHRYRWYLAILGCEHVDYPGHLLGRVCYIPESSVKAFVYPGYLLDRDALIWPDLVPLSPETVEHCRPHTETKTVYIPHPDRTTRPASTSWRPKRQPYAAIKLVLLGDIEDALRSRGYSVDLHEPDPDHPHMHRLTLSNDELEHTIAVEFEHTLMYGGRRFTIDAEVKISREAQLDEALRPADDQMVRHAVSWPDQTWPWQMELPHHDVRLDTAWAGTLTVELGLGFASGGFYFLRVDVLSEELPASAETASQPAGDRARGN